MLYRSAVAPSLDRLRVDNIGSMLRPEALKQAYVDRDAAHIDDDALRLAQDEAIIGVVAEQVAHGLPIVTDASSGGGGSWRAPPRWPASLTGVSAKPRLAEPAIAIAR